MSIILKQPLTGPATWRGADLVNDTSWIKHLSADMIAELDAALAEVKRRGLSFPNFSADDFPIQTLKPLLDAISEELENGRGFSLLRGLPVERYSDDEIHIINYGIGLHMGEPVRQNAKGDLLGLVQHVGDVTKKETRVYQTNLYLPYHSDPSDVVGLLCVRKAKQGGVSSLISVGAIYNELLKNSPEYLGLYYRPMFYAHLDQDLRSPLFSYHAGKLSCRYLRQYIELGHEQNNRPLSQVEVEALDAFDAAMQKPELRLDMMLEPGDLQFANNYAVLHSRNAFEDFEEEDKRRKMYRLWLKMPNARALSPEFPGRSGFSGVAAG
ncbi:TauD/TfdA family dioxygenase [Pigmentiphaga aceris]|uniref:TauD/TfdA family dioxygenase n=1 Tax=Pigmentiphaga aceris TaxID=1940612 RepID=A0A5C0AV54_9BURK|nr:TauD/TfdA family dioxygenase [Pigmentiphaga aceris]QEI06228.1 TauD/TfdA family dioxygenase [Pigmentiphaga aceris]